MSSPIIAHTREEIAEALSAHRGSGAPVALVPTMGALHEGHTSLMEIARRRVGAEGAVVASIFVNPLQFAKGEDLASYPRTFDIDYAQCTAAGVDVIFAPTDEVVYPTGQPTVRLDPGPLGLELEGQVRPTHFSGVLTVVAKLLGLVGPEVAVFGEKDYQQLVLLRRMASDLCLPTVILGAPIVREQDGLALSSRNRYLSAEQRESATALYRTLLAAQYEQKHGTEAAMYAAHAELRSCPGVDLDYLEIRDPELGVMEPVPPGTVEAVPARLLIAARVGTTRLLDNAELQLGRRPEADRSPSTTTPETAAKGAL